MEIPPRGDLPTPPRLRTISPLARRELEAALSEDVGQGDRQLELDGLPIAVLRSADGGAARTLERLGVPPGELLAGLVPRVSGRPPA